MAYVEYEADGKTIKARVQQKTDTLANWMANDNIILAGEQAFVVNDDGTPLNFKIGDGTKPFRDLPNWIDFSNAQRVSSVAPGVLPAGPAGETRYMEVTAVGTYTYGGNTLATITEDGYKATFWWTGSAWISNGVVKVKGDDGNAKLELHNPSKVGGYSQDVLVRDSNDVEYISLANNNTAALTDVTKWRLVANGTVDSGVNKTVTGDTVYKAIKHKSNYNSLNSTAEQAGVDYFAVLERGSINKDTGALVDYVSGQPRMRSTIFDTLDGNFKITSAKEFFVIVYDVTNKVIRNTLDTDGWKTSLELNGSYNNIKFVAKNVDNSIITDDDLVNSIKVERISKANLVSSRVDALKSFVPQKDYTLIWKSGTIPVNGTPIDNIDGTPITNVVYSSFYRSTSKTAIATVDAGYLIGACVYNSPDYSLNSKVHYVVNTSNSIALNINKGVYVAFFIKKVDNSTFLPADIANAGLSVSGLISTYKDLVPLPKEKLNKPFVKTFEQGQWTDEKTKLAATNRIRWVSAYASNKNAYFTVQCDPTYNFDILVFKGASPTLVYKETQRDRFNFNVKKGDNIVINLYRVDRADITPAVSHGFTIAQVDSEVNPIAFINLNGKLNKDIFSADEYGLSPDNDNNSDALNNLIEYLDQHGGGKVLLPNGIWSFGNRVWVRSGIQFVGASRQNTILRMFGISNYSLFDNGNRAVYGISFKNMTIDAYDHNPAGYSTDGKAFNFHYVFDSEFCDMTIRGTQGTGIGTDFLHGVKIMNNHIIECGRGWQDLPMYEGGSGIGIGTGGNVQENFIVSNNVVERCGQNGIFLEDQGIWFSQQWPTRGQIIANNIVHSGRKNGLAARGNTFCNFNNNIVYGNINGFFADLYLREAKIDNNQFYLNTNGINISSTTDTSRVTFSDNEIVRNTSLGVRMISDNMKDILFQGNRITDNSKGIVLAGSSEGNMFVDNKVLKNPVAALEYSGTQKDFIHQRNIVKGTQTITTTFTGDNTFNDLV